MEVAIEELVLVHVAVEGILPGINDEKGEENFCKRDGEIVNKPGDGGGDAIGRQGQEFDEGPEESEGVMLLWPDTGSKRKEMLDAPEIKGFEPGEFRGSM